MNSQLDIAKRIMRTLADHGHQACLVGGFVRDNWLGRPARDIDIATSATPEEVARLFERTEPTGMRHGTVTVIVDGTPFEVTTFRVESGYADHRRPDSVTFVKSLVNDLSRRDFTMNAMAMTADGELIDPFGGADDLEAGVLRSVGDPQTRFEEDALRLLRCIRFAADYGLAVDGPTWDGLLKRAPLLGRIAVERIRTELERIVEGSDPARGLKLLSESGILRAAEGAGKAVEAVGAAMERAAADGAAAAALNRLNAPAERWALLFLAAGIGAGSCAETLRALTFSGRKTDGICAVLRFHEALGKVHGAEGEAMRRGFCVAVVESGKPAAEAWLNIADALREDSGGQPAALRGLERAAEEGRRWLAEMPVTSLKELDIDGRGLIALGVRPGPEVGRLLKLLLAEAAAGEVVNSRERLAERARRRLAGEDGR